MTRRLKGDHAIAPYYFDGNRSVQSPQSCYITGWQKREEEGVFWHSQHFTLEIYQGGTRLPSGAKLSPPHNWGLPGGSSCNLPGSGWMVSPCRWKCSCGVPQGNVLGPFQWNIGYDWVLHGAQLPGIAITCYAEDTLITACGETHQQMTFLAITGVKQIVERIRCLSLEMALNKSDVLFSMAVDGVTFGIPHHRRRRSHRRSFDSQCVLCALSLWHFGQHFNFFLAP